MVAAMYGVPKAGAIAMFANTRLVPSEIVDLIADVRPTVVIGSVEQVARISGPVAEVKSVRCVLRGLPTRPKPGSGYWFLKVSVSTT